VYFAISDRAGLAQAYDVSKRLIRTSTPSRRDSALSTSELAVAGFMSAVPTTLVTAPVERAKVLLQVQGQGGSGTQYNGVFDVIGHLYREGGIRSIYRGTFATLTRDGPGSAAYFAAYEVTKKSPHTGQRVIVGSQRWSSHPGWWNGRCGHVGNRHSSRCSEIKVTVCTHRYIFWYHGLCSENYRRGWCESSVEGVRTGDGTSIPCKRSDISWR